MSSAIEVTGLRQAFHGRTVLDGVDLSVEHGEIFALLGPNGAGKTTLISILTTLLRPDAGTVVVAGHDVRADPRGVRRRIALTGQSAAVDDVLTGAENLRMVARLHGVRRDEARDLAAAALERAGLTDAATRRVATYSGGMRRRLDLALSLLVRPEVLFLDEPTTGLDTRSRLDLWNAVRELAGTGTTVFLTTQYLEEADRLADRVAVLDTGRIVALDTAAALTSRIGEETVEVRTADGAVTRNIPTDGTIGGLRTALDALGTAHDGDLVAVRRPTLDDVFLALTADGSPR